MRGNHGTPSQLALKGPLTLICLLGLLTLATPAAAQTIGMVADDANASVTVFDADTDFVLGSVSIDLGPVIGDCSISPDQTLGFVTNLDNELWAIDLTSSPPTLAGGTNPIPISIDGEDTSVSPDGKFVVICGGGVSEPVSVVDIVSQSQVSTFALGSNCTSVDVCSDGSVLVTSIGSDIIRRLSIDGLGILTDTGDSLPFVDPVNVACAPDAMSGVVLKFSSSDVSSFTLPSLTVADTDSLSGSGISSAFNPSGNRLYGMSTGAVDVFSYDSATGAIGALQFSISLSANDAFFGIDQLALHPDGSKLYVSQSPALEVYDASLGTPLPSITGPDIDIPTGVCFPGASPTGVDLAVSRTESIDPVVAGSGPGNLTLVVTVTNSGLAAASGVELSEVLTLPSGVAVDSITPSVGTFGGTTWTLGSLAIGASETLTVVFTADSSTASGVDTICGTATVTGVNETDTNPANDSATECTSTTREVDLAVTQSESIDPVVSPGSLSYVVTVINDGPSDASGVELSEVLNPPSGVTVDSITPSVGTFGGTIWMLGNLANGASETLTVELTVGSATIPGTDVICSTASVANVNETDINPFNDSATECTSVSGQVDLAVSQTESHDPVVPPDTLSYLVTVINDGPSGASGVEVSEVLTLPPGVTVDSITPSAGTVTGTTWALGTLASGASETLTVVLAVGSMTVPGINAICGTATVTAVNETDTNPTNDSVTECTSVAGGMVDLTVTQSESIDPVVAAGSLLYGVTVTNNGPSGASGVVIGEVLSLPTGVTVDSITPSVGTFAGTTWDLGNLGSSASATLTVALTVGCATESSGVIISTATVIAVNETDTNTSNDSAMESTSVVLSFTTIGFDGLEADMEVTDLQGAMFSSDPGAEVRVAYVEPPLGTPPPIICTWDDDSTCQNSVFIDFDVPVSCLSFKGVGAKANGQVAEAEIFENNVSVAIEPILANGDFLTPIDVDLTAYSDVTRIAISHVNEVAGTGWDNFSFLTLTNPETLDLAVTQMESVDPVVAGSGPGNLTYVVTVTNNGPADASGVQLSESLTLPLGVTIDSITPSAGTFAGTTWALGNLPSGASETLAVVLTAGSSTSVGTDIICSMAAVSAVNETDFNPANDSATECTSVVSSGVDLAVTITESIDPVVTGSGPGNLTYIVTATNNGPSGASGVAINAMLTLPTGVIIDSITPSAGTFGSNTWTLGTLPNGASETLTVVLTVGGLALPSTDSICSTAAVIAVNETDVNPANDSAMECTSVVPGVDLVVTISESADPVDPGSGPGNLTHVVTVKNNGPSVASGVLLSAMLALPPGVTVDSIIPSAGTFGGTTWTLGSLGNGASETLTVVLTVDGSTAPGCDVICSTVAVLAVNETDINSANDSDIECTSVAAFCVIFIDGFESGDTTAWSSTTP